MRLPASLAMLVLLAAGVRGQDQPDPALLAVVRGIRAVDNHSHIPPSDVLPVLPADGSLGRTPFPYPLRLRLDNPEWSRAWAALYGTSEAPVTRALAEQVVRRKVELMRAKGPYWPLWAMDSANIETALVNGPQRPERSPRLRWVPHANTLINPFGSWDTGPPLTEPPALLERYVSDVLATTLLGWRQQGAVAVKLSVAYDRSLLFRRVPVEEATQAYAAGRGATPEQATALQDHLLRILLREAGHVGLVVHVHTGIGADPWFRLQGADPLLLEDVLNDPEVRATRVVLVHGGWPFERQAGVMLIKPNLWADFSAQTFLRSPRALAATLREWLEWYPEKVLYGTDAYPDPETPAAGWEEMLWLANDSARWALALALTGMMNDGLVTRERAEQVARLVLRDNALRLYGLE
jgi:predicted TIM-barrel fold metal-dependent hydrolase